MKIDFQEFKSISQDVKRDKKMGMQAIGYLFHRDISVYISYFLARYSLVTANQISILMILVGILGCFFIFLNNSLFVLIGFFFLYVSFILDKVDGELARYKKTFSLRGMYLDELYHVIIPQTLLITFFLGTVQSEIYGQLILFLTVLLSLFKRYDRKAYILFSVKRMRELKSNLYTRVSVSKQLEKILNNPLFKFLSIVERFDILLFVCFLISVFEVLDVGSYRFDFLIVVFLLTFFYFLRSFLLNYFGRLDKMSSDFLKEIEYKEKIV